MLRFTKLRLSGFKSFVEGTDLQIELGLTGVVGPNGCGKSNLVEALRWVMGETSAKLMRGGEMDDVIFGGSGSRPSRNIAEVILNLDNSERSAPAQFNEFGELEVSRRIEREKGSTYRVNGREVRARDVQLLFADSATGARSTALVSQGRVGAVIAAKPTERRLLLEEAAGITGLHSRRHEAELRLRGAETNLARLDDVLVTLDQQMANLKKQARQATRYRNISAHIRKAEATLLYVRWIDSQSALELAEKELAEMEKAVANLTGVAAAVAARQAEHAAEVPAHRRAEAEAAAELQRLTVARDGLDAEEQRIAAATKDCRERIEQTAADRRREEALVADADAALQRLADELGRIGAPEAGEADELDAAARNLAAANTAVEDLDGRLTALTERAANDEARRTSLVHKIEDLNERQQRLAARDHEITEQRTRVESEATDIAVLADAERRLEEIRARRDITRQAADAAEKARAETTERMAAAVNHAHAAAAAAARLEAEIQALAAIFDAAATDRWPPVIDALAIEPGYEAALAAALGEDLVAATDEAAPSHWRAMTAAAAPPALPGGMRALKEFVRAPQALDRRLAQIGVVADDDEGRRLAPSLAQGQRLVSRSGALWRWDGFTMSAAAATAAGARIEQRKRLKEARATLAEAEATARVAQERVDAARAHEERAREAERAARDAHQAADSAFGATRDSVAELKERAAGHESLLGALGDRAVAIETDLRDLEREQAEAQHALTAMPDAAAARDTIAKLRAELAAKRADQLMCQSRHDGLQQAAEERRQRLAAIETETASWRDRRAAATAQLLELEERRRGLEEELARLAQRPAEIARQRQSLLAAIESSEDKRKTLADELAEAEQRLAEADKALRAAEGELAEARENRVRREGIVEQAKQSCHAIAERIKDRLDCRPDQVFELSGLKPDSDKPDLEAVERKVERLNRERETMGPVNLRAETEASEMQQQVDSLQHEREDLIQAIEKLRRGIAELNREGRQRLLTSFEEVNKHFQQLFVKLFGGGRAHLQLTESDDPLDAGLEIMASPPGKRLQVLSLLSGGEQALTALSLLFAVFQTNPAPICVLDEVDAPLDDANVERFCNLLVEMASSDRTRFICITHHHMTMARMDRLYGVTMAERGVSQLVSVDLHRAEELRATA
ncbi:MAG TPA: chromosome segregation protein SMC [Rhodospirillales bacterium]